MNQLIFHPKAQDELFSAIGYYNEHTPGELEENFKEAQKTLKSSKISSK